MVLLWTSYRYDKWTFILARNYNGFVVDMDSLVQLDLHFSKGFQWFWCVPSMLHGCNPNMKPSQIGIRCSRPENAPRGSKSTTFAKGIVQLFNLQKIGMNPVGDPSVLPIQSPLYLWLQAAAWEAFAIGGWCVVSCHVDTVFEIYGSTIGVSKFTVQP